MDENANLNILIVEDNFEHLRLTTYILEQHGVPGSLFVVRDGQEAMDYLYRRRQFTDPACSPIPHLILLDLNIPRIDGKAFLKTIKGDPSFKQIPVIVMSSSDREEDIQFARAMGAAAYVSKSHGFEKLSEALASIHTFVARHGL